MDWLFKWLPLLVIWLLFNVVTRLVIHYKFKEMTKYTTNVIIIIGVLLILYFYACYVCFC